MSPSPADNTNKTGEDANICKQGFKGIETFLRRIAFNLGNSPSQTEVKIISCIPIDVTDLQNKIISLERQLLEATNCKASAKQAAFHPVLVEPTIRKTNAVISSKCSEAQSLALGETSGMPSQCGDESSRTRKSTVSFLFPTLSATGLHHNQPVMLADNWVEESLGPTSIVHHKRFFRKLKKKKPIKKKENQKTQLVYYAQTENSPFTSYGRSTDIPLWDCSKANFDNALSKTYLANVFQRHFDPERVVEEFSDTSHFTSPVCRDLHSRCHCQYESDVCSCCHGHFQDVDKYYIGKNQNFIIEPVATHMHNDFNKDIYYDSNLYDIVPVKEKVIKSPKDVKLPIKEPKRPVDIGCWPENARTKQRRSPARQPHTKMYNKINNYRKPTYTLEDEKDNTMKIKTPKHFRENKVDKISGPTDTSKSCCIDCSEIYPKLLDPPHRAEIPATEPMRTIFRKNAACLTIDVDTKNLTITKSIQIDINSTETKTEETLNQIKSILQSVLAEVKTNPQVNNLPEAKSKKDAIIQKGPSQSNMPTCSSLLHSFTYNSSNTNPYVPSCSRQITTPYCYTSVPCQRPNCMQNFPLLVQTPGHQKCGCFYKSSHKNTPAQKQAANTSTNTETENQETQGGETEKLIKEIYKSIALSMDFQKETSNSEYNEIQSVTNNSTDASDLKELRSTIVAMTDAPRNIQIEAATTPLSTTTITTNYNRLFGEEPNAKLHEVEHYLDYASLSTENEQSEVEQFDRGKANVASTITEHSQELTTDAESEGIVETIGDVEDKTEKKSLLKRMLGSVKLFSKKKQNKTKDIMKQDSTHNDVKSETDSDDYQTIYSEKSHRPEKQFNRNRLYKRNHYATYGQGKNTRVRTNRRSPYMEQEYRRQWNEQLMFQENKGRRYSSERPYSSRQSPVYWHDYEARSAIVDHRVPFQGTYNPKHSTPIKSVTHKVEQQTSPLSVVDKIDNKSKFSWLKKHKLGISQCGEQWKKFILEN